MGGRLGNSNFQTYNQTIFSFSNYCRIKYIKFHCCAYELRKSIPMDFRYLNIQAKRGFAKEASVYFPYLDSVLFCTVHYATLPFHHSAIPPFRHSAIPPFRHSAIPSFRHSTIPPFRHSAILLQYAITRCMYHRRS